MSDLMLDVDQASELKAAFRRGGYSNAEIKALSEGNMLGKVRDVIRGSAEIRSIEHLIDFDKAPSIPDGWSILPEDEQLPNRVRGQIKFDPTKVAFHLDDGQKNRKVIEGNELRKKLNKVPVYGAQLLDFYLANPHLIPEAWKKDENGNTRYIFFWGTIYRRSGGSLRVRCLCWDGGGWRWDYHWLGDGWGGSDPAAVSAS